MVYYLFYIVQLKQRGGKGMIQKIEIIYVDVEKLIFHIQLFILILNKNMMEFLLKVPELGLIQNQKGEDQKRMIF